MRRRRTLRQVNRSLVAALSAIVLILVFAPGSAWADGVLIPDRPQIVRSTATSNWAFNTTKTYWSVVAVQPLSGLDYDLSVSNETGVLAESTSRDDVTEWVAINSNVRPVWSYRATVARYSGRRPGSDQYRIQLAQTNQVLRSEWFEQHLALGNGPSRFPGFIAVRDIWLDADRAMIIHATNTCEAGERNLIQAAVLSPRTSVATAADAVAASAQTGCSGTTATTTVRYHATQTGWHGLVIYVNNQRLPHPTEVEVLYSVGIP